MEGNCFAITGGKAQNTMWMLIGLRFQQHFFPAKLLKWSMSLLKFWTQVLTPVFRLRWLGCSIWHCSRLYLARTTCIVSKPVMCVCVYSFPSCKGNNLFLVLRAFWLFQILDCVIYFGWCLWCLFGSHHSVKCLCKALWRIEPTLATCGWLIYEKYDSPEIGFLFTFSYEVGNKLEVKWNQTSCPFFSPLSFMSFRKAQQWVIYLINLSDN